MSNFRDSLLKSAADAFESGEISRQDLRRIRLASAFPRLCSSIEKAVSETAHQEGMVADAVGAIDWAKLLDFIKQLIPLILELIKLFK